MENRVSVWKANLNSGLILALGGILFTLLLWFLDQSLNKSLGYIWLIILVVALFFLIKSYRDNTMNGYITYGQSLGAGVVILLYYAIVTAVFTYIFHKFIDPGLVDKMIAMAEQAMVDKGIPEAAMEQGLKIQQKIMQPAILAGISIINTMFMGTIITLIMSIFIRREGNPLIDDTIDE